MHVKSDSFVQVWAFLVLLLSSAVHAAVFPWVGDDLNGLSCETTAVTALKSFGPFDYTDRRHHRPGGYLEKVNSAHYTPRVIRLKGGVTGSAESDLHYTISIFPNHHAALFTLVRLYTENCELCRPPGADITRWKDSFPPAECYLNRALSFAKKDSAVPAIFGVYLHRVGHLEKAAQMYQRSLAIKSTSPEVHYNYGLVLVDLGRFVEAQKHADIAYKAGYPLTGLRMKLKRKLNEASASKTK